MRTAGRSTAWRAASSTDQPSTWATRRCSICGCARSSTPLVVECKRHGYPLARALIIPRADLVSGSTAQLLLPGGSSMLIIDHISGYMYQYPRWIRAQVGADMVFDRNDERGREPTPGVVTRQFDAQVRYAGGVQDTRVD